MSLKIYVAARPVNLAPLYGHLYLILWDEVAETGFTIGGNQIGFGDLLSFVHLPHNLPEGTGPEQNPDRFEVEQFDSLNKVEIGGIGDPQALWDEMVDFANGLGGTYDYDLANAAINADLPIANSNAFIFSTLNAVGINPRPLISAISGAYSLGVPGDNTNNSTLLGTKDNAGDAVQLIAASENLEHGVQILGRDDVDDVCLIPGVGQFAEPPREYSV